MITSTEDKFDVDYDVFSFAGRAAFMGGAIYALDKSIKEDVFKPRAKNLGALNNKYIGDVSDVLRGDDISPIRTKEKTTRPNRGSFFTEMGEPSGQRIKLSSVNDTSRISLKKLLNGGFKGMSNDLFDEIDALQHHIREIDSMDEFSGLQYRRGSNHISGQMSVDMDARGRVTGVNISSLAGTYNIPVVDKDGMVTIKDNRYATRAQFDADGLKPGKVIGVDVAMARQLREDHVSILRGKKDIGEYKHRMTKAFGYNGKSYQETSLNRQSKEVIQNTVNSAMLNTFKNYNGIAKKRIMKNAALEGNGVASASNLANGIIRLEGDSISEIDGLSETSNPNQLFRANTFYIDPEGNRKSITNLNYFFLDEKNMQRFMEKSKQYGVDFGELAEEELIGNKRNLGYIGDNSRSMQIRGDQVTDASEYILNRMINDTGLSKQEFLETVRKGGFNAFSPEHRLKLRNIGINDYHNYLREELKQAKIQRHAANVAGMEYDDLRKERRALIKEKAEYRRGKRGSLNKAVPEREIKRINNKIRALNKKLKPKIFKSQAYKDAMRLRQKGQLGGFVEKQDARIAQLESNLSTSRFFGVSKDLKEDKLISKKIQDAFIDDLHVSDNNILTFSLLKQSKIKQGVKGIDPSGEGKAVFKNVNDFVSQALIDMHIEDHGSISEADKAYYNNVHAVANMSAMKKEVTDRNMYDVLGSIRLKNNLESNESVSRLLSKFDSSPKADSDYEKLFRGLDKISNGDIISLTGKDFGIGFGKSKMAAFGSMAEDLGAGGLGFVAERHIQLMLASGMKSFGKSVMDRKTNAGMYRTYKDLQRVEELLASNTKAGFIDFANMDEQTSRNFIERVFPSFADEGGLSSVQQRKDYLRKIGKLENGAAFVGLGGTYAGMSKIPLLTDEGLYGLIGEQIGFDGDYKKYTEIDRLTKDILRESRRGQKDSKRLEQLVKNYKEAFKQLQESTRSRIFKGKVRNSMIGQATSGSEALAKYADSMFDSKIKYAAPSVMAVSQRKFVKMFGQEAYDAFARTGKSNSWAFAIREPVEGLSGLPVNVVPSNHFSGIKDLDDTRIAVVSGRNNSLLKMVFGDYDGDQLSLVAATNDASAKEIRDLATSNSENAVAFRKSQLAKTKFSLKGAHSKSILSHSLAELRLSAFHAKDLEKGFVGIASNSLKPLHEMNRRINSNTPKFYEVETMLHTIAENIIKGKAQSTEDLMNEKSKRLLDAIVGGEEFAEASTTDRVKFFREFTDQVMLGDAAPFADRIRAGERSEAFVNEISEALGGNTARARELVQDDWFTKLTNDDSMENLMEVSGLASKTSDEVDDATRRAVNEALDESAARLKRTAEDIEEARDGFKQISRGVGGNIAKYALAPAAVFGLMGTVFGARTSIRSDVEFSDAEYTHKSSSAFQSPYKRAVNMKSPTRLKPEVTGQAKTGFNIDKYASNHKISSVRLQDDTQNFDYYDMQEKIDRGY